MDHTNEEYHQDEGLENRKEDDDSKISAAVVPYILYAGFWIRFWAYLVDMIVVGSLNRIIVYPLLRAFDISLQDMSMLSITAISTALIMYLYFIVMTKLVGQTLGKMIFGLKVIPEENSKLTWGSVIFRELIGKFISKTVFFLGFIFVGFTAKKKGWHDYFAETIVIQERNGISLPNVHYKLN